MRLIDDDTLATLLIWGEARGETMEGKTAVAEVLINRMRRFYQSDGTLANTIFRNLQFSCVNSSNPWRYSMFTLDSKDKSVQDCRAAWEYAKGGSNLAGGAVLYYSDAGGFPAPNWAKAPNVKEVATIGHQHFYDER